jgi:hypothetical protein
VTDAEKLISLANFIHLEGIRVEDMLRCTVQRRLVKYREFDQLDALELIQLQDRYEYFCELSVVITNILFEQNRPRPCWRSLDTGRDVC